jgi:cyclopropane fatty-acyl-phospholipid synthase-like methyltransferase
VVKKLEEWEKMYRDQEPETMPWFLERLDPDLARALRILRITSGTALDIGTGPGTQAIALAVAGFEVTATDVSATALRKASARAASRAEGKTVAFIQDDILNTALEGEFDIILDRGCFHNLPPERRPDYVAVIERLVRPSGYLFLKCFSHLETTDEGPYRFSQDEIRSTFSPAFNVLSIHDTVYHGTLKPLPRALFSVMQRP